MRDLAIIMPTRNRPTMLAETLAKIRRHFPDAPILVFDDASDDPAAVSASVASVPGCELLRSEVNVGPAGARKLLIERADARWCLALDDDCHPSQTFRPERWIASEPGVSDPVIVSFRCYRPYDGDLAPAGDLQVGLSSCLLGGAALLHRASIIAIGNFNSTYHFGAEDTDLARRVWASGRQLWTDPENVIIHEHTPMGRDLQQEAFYYVRNRVLLGFLTLPLWYGLPYGLAQAVKRWLSHPYKLEGVRGLFAGLSVSIRHFKQRRPLTLQQHLWLSRLPS